MAQPPGTIGDRRNRDGLDPAVQAMLDPKGTAQNRAAPSPSRSADTGDNN